MTYLVTAVIPSIPPRRAMLARAVESVMRQTTPVAAISVALDCERRGAADTRDRALAAAATPYVAFLDDDDELYPHHVKVLLEAALSTGADLVYPWFDVGSGGTDPFPQHEGKPWDPENPHQVPVTFLAKTELVRDVGGFSKLWPGEADPGTDAEGNRAGEDYRLMLRLSAKGAHILHVPERTWLWHHHGANTSGLPSRW